MTVTVKAYAGFATGDMSDKIIELDVPDNFHEMDSDAQKAVLDEEFNAWASANIISEYTR